MAECFDSDIISSFCTKSCSYSSKTCFWGTGFAGAGGASELLFGFYASISTGAWFAATGGASGIWFCPSIFGGAGISRSFGASEVIIWF